MNCYFSIKSIELKINVFSDIFKGYFDLITIKD